MGTLQQLLIALLLHANEICAATQAATKPVRKHVFAGGSDSKEGTLMTPDLASSVLNPLSIVREAKTSRQVDFDGSIKMLRNPIDAKTNIAASIVREAKKSGDVHSDGSIEISDDSIDSKMELPSIVREAKTSKQVDFDGNIKMLHNPIDASTNIAARIVREAKKSGDFQKVSAVGELGKASRPAPDMRSVTDAKDSFASEDVQKGLLHRMHHGQIRPHPGSDSYTSNINISELYATTATNEISNSASAQQFNIVPSGFVELKTLIAQHDAEAEDLLAWRGFYERQQEAPACPLPSAGFECDHGHECTFKTPDLGTYTVATEGDLTEVAMDDKIFYIKGGSKDEPPYYYAVIKCEGSTDVLLKAPAYEAGEEVVGDGNCSNTRAQQTLKRTNNKDAIVAVDRVEENGYLCINAIVSDSEEFAGIDSTCLDHKTPSQKGPTMVHEKTSIVIVTKETFFKVLQGDFGPLHGRCGKPHFALAQLDKAVVTKSGGIVGMVTGVVLMASAFVLTGVSGGTFVPVATIVFGWGAGFVVSGANAQWGSGAKTSGCGVLKKSQKAATAITGIKPPGPKGAGGSLGVACAGLAIGVHQLTEALGDRNHGQDGTKYLKNRAKDHCLDYGFKSKNVYMHSCHSGENQKWFFAGQLWLNMGNELHEELNWNDGIKDLEKKEETLLQAREKCTTRSTCNAFCWNPDDWTSYHVQTGEQGWYHHDKVKKWNDKVKKWNSKNFLMGWKCFKKAFFGDGLALATKYDDRCLEYAYWDHEQNVYMAICNGGRYQQWYWDGEQLKTKQNDKCLDMSLHMSNNNVYMNDCHGGSNQKWRFSN